MIRTGARSIAARQLFDQRGERLRAAGRGADQQRARHRRRERPQRERRRLGLAPAALSRVGSGAAHGARQAGSAGTRAGADGAAARRRAAAEVADFLDQLAAEIGRGRGLARGRGLRNIIGGAERQRAQADLGAAARQRRGHDHDEVALLLQKQRQRRNAVELRHLDVEHDDVGVAALDLVDRLTPGAERRRDRHVGFGVDPARHQAARDDRVVHDHDADRSVGGSRTIGGGKGDTHDYATSHADFTL